MRAGPVLLNGRFVATSAVAEPNRVGVLAGEKKSGHIDSPPENLDMRNYRLTNFDQVWDALRHPGNTSKMAQAYRGYLSCYPPACSAEEADARNLNFLLSKCDRSSHPDQIRHDDIKTHADGERVFPLRHNRAAKELTAFARQLVEASPAGRVSDHLLPQVSRAPSRIRQFMRDALPTFKRPDPHGHHRRQPADQAGAASPLRPAVFWRGRPYAADVVEAVRPYGTAHSMQSVASAAGQAPQGARPPGHYAALLNPPPAASPGAPALQPGARGRAGGPSP